MIYVMPNAVTNAGPGDNSQVVVDSSHNGKEPQVAKIYQELQHRKECQPFSENMIREKADYFLLLQHGGGKGNRWAVSDRNGDVVASGDSLLLGNSVKDACLAIARIGNSMASGRETRDTYPCKPRSFRARRCCDRLGQLEAEVGVKHLQAGAFGNCPCLLPTILHFRPKA